MAVTATLPAEEKREKRKRYEVPVSLMLGGAGAAALGSLAIPAGLDRAINRFSSEQPEWSASQLYDAKGKPDANAIYKIIEGYTSGGSKLTRSDVAGVPANKVVEALRHTPGLPGNWQWKEDSGVHYDEFSKGPLYGYLQFLRESYGGDKKHVVEDITGRIERAAQKISGKPLNQLNPDEQSRIFRQVQDKANNVWFPKTDKLNVDAGMAPGMASAGQAYSNFILSPLSSLRKSLIYGGGAVAATGGALALYTWLKHRAARKKEEEVAAAEQTKEAMGKLISTGIKGLGRWAMGSGGKGLATGAYKSMIAARRAAATEAKNLGGKFINRVEDMGVEGMNASYTPGVKQIKLGPNANRQSLRHELGHFYQDAAPQALGPLGRWSNMTFDPRSYQTTAPLWQRFKAGVGDVTAETQARMIGGQSPLSAMMDMHRNSSWYSDYWRNAGSPGVATAYKAVQYAPHAAVGSLAIPAVALPALTAPTGGMT